MSTTLQFGQKYIDKKGISFYALDTHTFFFGSNNVALADFVTVKPLPSAVQDPIAAVEEDRNSIIIIDKAQTDPPKVWAGKNKNFGMFCWDCEKLLLHGTLH